MQYRKLGRTDIEASAVAFGGWAIVGGFTWGPQEDKDSLAALRSAYDAGITLFDTAEAYGDGKSEELIGKALYDVRDSIVIASKVSRKHLSTEDMQEACERSLRALRTDRIDLYQVHWPNPELPIQDTLTVLEGLKTQGKIREYGISNFGAHELTDLLGHSHAVRSDQLAYNLLFRAIEYDVLPVCEKESISVLCYSPLMQGLLTGKFTSPDDVPEDRARTRHYAGSRPHSRHDGPGEEPRTFEAAARVKKIAEELGESMADVSLAWLLAQPGVTSVIVGGRNADQARRNASAADLVLDPGVVAELSAATDDLKTAMGSNPDMWQCEGRIQ